MDAVDPPVLMTGDYFPGGYGPSILLALSSPAAARWLRDLLDDLAEVYRGEEHPVAAEHVGDAAERGPR